MDYNSTFLLYAAGLAILVLVFLLIPARYDPAIRIKAMQSGVPVATRPNLGATVVCFDCRGCMAEDHQLDWIGVVAGHAPNRLTSESVVCKVLKRGSGPSDSRDGVLGFEKPVWDQGPFQKVGPNLYFLFR